MEQGRQEIRDLFSPESGSVELAVTMSSTLSKILRNFRAKQPHVRFTVQMVKPEEMVQLLHRGEVDFCLSSPLLQGEEIVSKRMGLDSILVAVPKRHRLADRISVCLSELKDEWFVGLKQGYPTRDLTDRICQSVDFTSVYVYEGDEPARLRSLVEAEIGITFVPETSTWNSSKEENIKILKVDHLKSVREIGLTWHKSRYFSQAALEFRETVIEYFLRLHRDSN